MKKLIVFILVTLVPFLVFSASYEIEAYDIAIEAEKDGTLKIRETLDVRFFEKSHGIYRDIQYSFKNPDGNSFDNIKAEISDVSATSLLEMEKEDGMLRLTLGDDKEYASERERYVIEYSYRLDYNRSVGYDELYYNIISPAWDTTIRNITWSVSLPSPVEKDKIWVTEGKEGSIRKGEFEVGVNNTRIAGRKDMLLPSCGLTLRVEMAEGYWKNWPSPSDNSKPFSIAALVISIIYALSSAILWVFFGRDEKIDASGSRNTPPEGMNPMDAGFIIDQSSSPAKEGFAMIFKWAEEGRLTVSETKGKYDTSKPSYKFTKIRDLDPGAKESERALFDSVFFKDEVTLDEMAEHGFTNDYNTKVLKALTKEFSSLKEKKSSVVMGIMLGAATVTAAASGILLSMKHPGALSALFVLVFLVPFFTVTLITALWGSGGKIWKKSTTITSFAILGAIVALGAGVVMLLSLEGKLSQLNILSAFASYALILIGAVFTALTEKMNKEGIEKLKACLEYRNYLSLLLDGTLSPDPQDREMWGTHMAYAMAMGLDSKDSNMEMEMPQPVWFSGSSWNGSWLTYYLIFHSCSSSYSTSFTHASVSAGGGSGISSHGFSGGGFSGGGGGRW